MKRHSLCDDNNFIMAWVPEKGDDISICDKLIKFHNDNKNLIESGKVKFINGDNIVNKDVKDSKDVNMRHLPESLKHDYWSQYLQPLVDDYRKKYEFIDEYARWSVVNGGNIQKYPPGGGYKQWHCERGVGTLPHVSRVLSYMTYLNDIEKDGETEFYYQKLKIKPVKGMTVIWGVDFSFTHRGIPAPNEEKWIATGWFGFELP
jgi:hypothetical protein